MSSKEAARRADAILKAHGLTPDGRRSLADDAEQRQFEKGIVLRADATERVKGPIRAYVS